MINQTIDFVVGEQIDLSNCDREPIHIPGSIQPHGALVVFNEQDLTIHQVSHNTDTIFGLPSQQLLGTDISQIFNRLPVEKLQATTLPTELAALNPFKLPIRQSSNGIQNYQYLNGIVHRRADDLILEIEPTATLDADSLLKLYDTLQASIASLEKAPSLEQLCQMAARQVRSLTNYDRVMIYRFDEAWNGQVIAEDKVDHLESFLGLHYPSSDIPKQARELYIRNRVRLIVDIDYQPVGLVCHNGSTQPLDMSLCVLRSVSPIHIEYLHNMGVKATMTISLIYNHKLWGLIACHHYSSKFVPYEIRKIAELLGQILSVLFFEREESDNYRYRLKLQTTQNELLNSINSSDVTVSEGLIKHLDMLPELVGATGVAICIENQIIRSGKTPTQQQISQMLDWLPTKITDGLFQTNRLSQQLPLAESFKETASGLLAITLSDTPGHYLLWFRPEVIQTVTWGGNPTKPVTVEEDGIRLSPRKSFEAWKQTVHLTAHPWQPAELEAATSLQRLKDINERQQAESVIHRQAHVFANIQDGIIVTDLAGKVVEWNRGAERLFGYLKKEALGQPIDKLLTVEPSESLSKATEQVTQGETWADEITFEGADDDRRVIEATSVPLKNQQNKLSAVINVYRDITERKLLEQQLHHSQKMEAIGQLAGGIAHNFNNLLTALMGYADFALDTLPDTHPARVDLQGVLETANRATNMTQELLAFTRRQAISPTMFDLYQLVSGTQKLLQQLISANITLSIKPQTEPCLVRADPGQIEQVLINLVINAQDAMPDGGELNIKTEPVTITQNLPQSTQEIAPGDYVRWVVSDTGTGMTEEVKNRIFEPFFTTKEVGKGTGLGLSTCFGIIRQNNGYIMVDSAPNQGTTFIIYLPRVQAPAGHSLDKSRINYLPQGTETIMLVEDEIVVGDLAKRALQKQGYTVLTAHDGKQALNLFEKRSPTKIHLLVTDLVMPKMGGRQLATVLRTIRPDIKILYISGYLEDELTNQNGLAEGIAFLQKPFSPGTLIRKVRDLLDMDSEK